jgi:hypothetical protein
MTAIVPYRRGDLRRGAASVLQFGADGIAADVRVERVDRRNRCSWYALKLASSRFDLTGRLVGLRRGGELDELGAVVVAAGSVGSARFAVTAPRGGAYDAMYLEIRSEEMLLRVDAPRPPAPRRFRSLKAGAAVLGVGIVLGCAGLVPRAFAHDQRTSVPLAVPTSAPERAAAAAVARIVSFSARRDPVPGGESILASYLAVADRGTLQLFDPAGKLIVEVPFAHVGTNRLAIPKAYRSVPLTAQITAHRGATKAVSTVIVPPNSLALPTPPAKPSAVPALAPDVPGEGVTPIDSASGGNDGMIGIEGHAVAGQPLHLRVMAQAEPMHVELEDASGAVIAESEIAAGATRAVLTLPPSDARATYLLALHYTRNGGEETVIRTVLAAPAPATPHTAAAQ